MKKCFIVLSVAGFVGGGLQVSEVQAMSAFRSFARPLRFVTGVQAASWCRPGLNFLKTRLSHSLGRPTFPQTGNQNVTLLGYQ